MAEAACIRVWVRDEVPERFSHLCPADEVRGVIALYLAHVPAAVLASPTYRRCNGPSGTDGWLPDGMLGLFGTNALNTHPHPDGDGVLIVGCCV
ncbi:hypothetical protein J0H58_36765 [bacterium]|nr:hypothetical protein [bacterium]